MTQVATVEEWLDSPNLTSTMITAPPGCGKTELLARRAARCVQMGLVPQHRQILALTFTNKAKSNLASRLAATLGPSYKRHVSVMNFHGLGQRIYQRHGYVLDTDVLKSPPDEGVLADLQRDVCDEHIIHKRDRWAELTHVRRAKAGPFSDEQVIRRLESSGSPAMLEYERRLQSMGLMDHDDVLRLALCVLQHPGVAQIYSERFCYAVIDEVQDLTRVQFDLVKAVAEGCTVFAGDRTQGIYTFAGAEPSWVFSQIENADTPSISLHQSYRSSPEVLAVVNAISAPLGGEALEPAPEKDWGDRGRAEIATFGHPSAEAAWLVAQISKQLERANAEGLDMPSIGVMTRMKPGGRRDAFLEAATGAGLPMEIWDRPMHEPEVAALLQRHVGGVVATVQGRGEQLLELQSRCLAALPPEDEQTAVRVRGAVAELSDLVSDDLAQLVGQIRVSSAPDAPIGPGVHLLTGHAGKGQGFDLAVIMGVEEGQLPSFFVQHLPDDDPEVMEELAVLHVMVSRAKEALLFTRCTSVRGFAQRPSRWLALIEPHLTAVPTH